MLRMMLWAWEPPTPAQDIGIYTGWGGAGLLGLVLSWLLLKHLPELDRSRKEDRESFVKALDDQRKELTRSISECRQEFAAILLRQEEKFEKNIDRLMERLPS